MKPFVFALAALAVSSSIAFAWDDTAKKVKGVDLAVQSHKYDGRLIQTTAYCFLADKEDVRCLAAFGARIDFSVVKGDGMSDYLFDKCDSIDNLGQAKCQFDIQFTYTGFASRDTGGGSQLTFVLPADNTGEFRRHKK